MSLPLPHRYLKQRYEISKHKNREAQAHGREAMTLPGAKCAILQMCLPGQGCTNVTSSDICAIVVLGQFLPLSCGAFSSGCSKGHIEMFLSGALVSSALIMRRL